MEGESRLSRDDRRIRVSMCSVVVEMVVSREASCQRRHGDRQRPKVGSKGIQAGCKIDCRSREVWVVSWEDVGRGIRGMRLDGFGVKGQREWKGAQF